MRFSQVGKFASIPAMIAGMAFPPLAIGGLMITGYSTITSIAIKYHRVQDVVEFGEMNLGRTARLLGGIVAEGVSKL